MRGRATLKRLAELGLDASGASSLLRRRMAGRDLVLAYHNVVHDDQVAAGASGHLGLANFVAQMHMLAKHADVVPVTSLAGPPAPTGRPRVAITFDDGYRGAIRLAMPVLASLGLPATIFVCPGLVGGEAFWWDSPDLDAWTRKEQVLDALQGRELRVREFMRWHGLRGSDRVGDFLPAREQELLEASERPGISIGAHTVTHPNLSMLPEEEVRSELAECRDRLAGSYRSAVRWIAYPFGLANPMVERVAAEEGYDGAFVLDGGWIPGDGRRITALPRLNIAAGLSIRGFRLRLAGLFAR